MNIELLILRLVHIVGGIFWVGGVLLTTLFLIPAIASMGPAGGEVFVAMQRRRLSTWMSAASLLTVLAGLRLMWITSGGFSAAYFATAPGRGFATAGALALLALLVGVTVARPAAMRAAQLGGSMAGAPPEQRPQIAAEMAVLRKRSMVFGTIVAVLLLLAAAGMSVARYLG